VRRSGLDPRRGASRGARCPGRRPDSGDRGRRVRVAGRHFGIRRTTPDDPPAQQGEPSMRPWLGMLPLVVVPVVLAAQQRTDTVERIEVVRGPTSVLYGSDAVTGVVQIFTRDGRNASRATVAFGGGTYATNAFDATASGGDDRVGYALGLSRFASDGIYRFNN